MIFLIEYSRPEGRVLDLKTFPNRDRRAAENARLEAELSLMRRGLDHEVVLLEAKSETAIRRTHRRYFEDARAIASSTGEA